MAEKKTSKTRASVPPKAAEGAKRKVPPQPPSVRGTLSRAGQRSAATPAPEPVPTEARREAHGFRRKIIGTVVSSKMAKTVVVEVIRKAMHPVYKKYVRVRNKYKAHDELNQYKSGDKVEIMEHRPISKQKRWTVTRLVSRPVEA
jgi:small subunit ribosomal protein S17